MQPTIDRESDIGHDDWPDTCPGSPDGDHRVRFVGYVQGGRVEGLDCAQPMRLVCRCCASRKAIPCGTRHESRCGTCSARHRRRLTRLAQYGTSIPSRARSGSMGMLTITAPGTTPDHHRVIPRQIYRRGQSRPVCGCERRLDHRGIPGWNPTTSARWNHLRTSLRREYPGLEFVKGTEVQKRQALHVHVLMWSPKDVDVALIHRLVLAAGFGCSIDWTPCEPGSRRMAGYIAKYVTKDAEPADVPWDEEVLDTRTGELVQLRRAHFRAWTASRGWGITMREIRAAAGRAAAVTASARRAVASPGTSGNCGDHEAWRSGGGGLPPPDR